MATKPKVYYFDEKSVKRIQEMVRRQLAAPKTGAQRRQHVPVQGR